MKKLFVFLLILALMLCTVGCQGFGDPEYAIKKAYLERLPEHMRDDYTPNDIPIWSYGTYNGCTVGYFSERRGGGQAITEEEVGNYVFIYPDTTRMLAYKDGQIKLMPEAYELGWLDDDAVKQIYEKHRQEYSDLYEYMESKETYLFNDQGLPIISDNLRSKINKALKEYDDMMSFFNTEDTWGTAEKFERIRYYGTFEGYDIVFYDMDAQIAVTGSVKVGDYIFSYRKRFAIVGHKGGVVYDLVELYNKGEISAESVAKMYQYHLLHEALPRE